MIRLIAITQDRIAMAAGSTDILNRPVGSSSSSTTTILPDPDGPLSETVLAKAIELANAEVNL